jgi:hypothetical protein
MRRAANKILWLTIAAGGAELMLEAFSPVGHNDLLGLAGNASSLGLDIVARHYVKHDEHHSHNEIGHTHTDMDVRVSSVGLAGNVIATATHQHWVLFPVAFYGIAKAAQSVRSIRKHATSIENHN